MAEQLLRTSLAIESCEKHIKDELLSGSDIETFLSQYVVVLLCAEVQQSIYEIVEKLSSTFDIDIQNYLNNSSRKLLRSIRKDELANFISLFGTDKKKLFNSQLNDSEITYYNNAVEQRHRVAHSLNPKVTLLDVKYAYEAAGKMLTAFKNAL